MSAIITGSYDLKCDADAARAIHVAGLLVVVAMSGQLIFSGPLLAATVVIFVIALILVALLKKKRSRGVTVSLFLITVGSGVLQLAMMYHDGQPSLGRIAVVVACLFASVRVSSASKYLDHYAKNPSRLTRR